MSRRIVTPLTPSFSANSLDRTEPLDLNLAQDAFVPDAWQQSSSVGRVRKCPIVSEIPDGPANTPLAIIDGHVVGFTDVDDDSYIDMLFVDPDFGRRGVVSALLASVIALAQQGGIPAPTTFASLTSRPVFQRHGLLIIGERYFGEGDGAAKTYARRRVLTAPPRPSVGMWAAPRGSG